MRTFKHFLLTLALSLQGFCPISAKALKDERQETYNEENFNLNQIAITARDGSCRNCEASREAIDMFDIRVESLPQECQNMAIARNCAEITACTKRSGYYNVTVLVEGYPKSYLVECDAHTEGGGWTVIQRRQDGSVDFYRTWDNYKNGFGNIEGEFFIGLDRLYALTNFNGPQELLILMEGINQTAGNAVVFAYAKYSSFAIGNESEKYELKQTGNYSGTAGDSLRYHVGCKFTTKDQDNDSDPDGNCAVLRSGAWWYKNCYDR